MVRKVRSSRRPRTGSSQEGWKIGLGVAFGALALAGFGGIFYLRSTSDRPALRDTATLCPLSGPTSIQVILLDATDDLPPAAKKEIATLLGDSVTGAPPNQLIEIRLLDTRISGGKVVFSRCNPGDGAGLSEWTANPAMAKRQWVESYQKPVQEALKAGLRPSQAGTSPILSTLQTIALERFTGRAASSVPKRLIVLSDLIEHGPKYSQYSGKLAYGEFRKSDLYKDVRTNLNAAEVTLYQVQRQTQKPLPSAGLIQFWIDWIADNNGQFKEAVKLQGLG